MRLDRKYVLGGGLGRDEPSVDWTSSRSIFLRYSNVQALITLEASDGWKVVADNNGVSNQD